MGTANTVTTTYNIVNGQWIPVQSVSTNPQTGAVVESRQAYVNAQGGIAWASAPTGGELKFGGAGGQPVSATTGFTAAKVADANQQQFSIVSSPREVSQSGSGLNPRQEAVQAQLGAREIKNPVTNIYKESTVYAPSRTIRLSSPEQNGFQVGQVGKGNDFGIAAYG
jgi:hypothetical protein